MCVNMKGMIASILAAPCCPSLVDRPLDEAAAEELTEVFRALADPTRLRLVSLLATAPEGELCACDLPASLGRAQPTVSHHLGVLQRAGLVEREPRGKWAWFRLKRARLAELCAVLGGGVDGEA